MPKINVIGCSIHHNNNKIKFNANTAKINCIVWKCVSIMKLRYISCNANSFNHEANRYNIAVVSRVL